jgi:hypothetical protein
MFAEGLCTKYKQFIIIESAAVAIVEYLRPTIIECGTAIEQLWVDYNADDANTYSRGWLLLTGL